MKLMKAAANVSLPFAEQLLAMLRTASALLIGNAALIYFDVVGSQSHAFSEVLLSGIALGLVCSIPVSLLIKTFKE